MVKLSKPYCQSLVANYQLPITYYVKVGLLRQSLELLPRNDANLNNNDISATVNTTQKPITELLKELQSILNL